MQVRCPNTAPFVQITRLDYVPISAGERASAPPAGFAKKKAMLLRP